LIRLPISRLIVNAGDILFGSTDWSSDFPTSQMSLFPIVWFDLIFCLGLGKLAVA